MAYIDESYYTSVSATPLIGEFLPAAERASDLIDAYTLNAVERFNLENDYPVLFEKVKKAVAYQVEFIMQNGGLEAWAMASDDLASKSENYSTYSISETYRQGSSGHKKQVGTLELAPLAGVLLAGIVGLGRRARW